tara:strand:- start:91 stop:318 length:228 start_codon:yes stop_codon:yes gene_type:complete
VFYIDFSNLFDHFFLLCSVAHHRPWAMFRYITLHKLIVSKMTPEAEKFNGWAAMLGFVAAFGAYATTGQIIPGIF